VNLLPLYSSSAFGATIQDNLTILIDLDQSVLGPISKQVSLAVRHLCGLIFPDDDLELLNLDDFYEVAKDYYEQIKYIDPTGRQMMSFLACLSGYYHELRHAHDLLATGYGQELIFTSLNCYQNLPALLTALADWLAQDERRRIPLPISAGLDFPDDIRKLLRYYDKVHSDIREFKKPKRASHAGLTTTHLLEGSAINTQLDFVHDVFGEEAVFALTEFIQRGRRSRVYLQIRNEVAETFYARGFRGWGLGAIINYLLWCSLMVTTFPGKKYQEGPTSVTLYEALAEHISRLADQMELPRVRELVLDFYERWGFLTPEQMVSRVDQTLVERASKVEQAWQRYGEEGRQLGFVEAYRSFTKAFSHINQWIRDHPEGYFGQRYYVWCVMGGLLPSVHVKLKLNGSVHDFMTKGYDIIPFSGWIHYRTLFAKSDPKRHWDRQTLVQEMIE